eukprot:sb/3473357/
MRTINYTINSQSNCPKTTKCSSTEHRINRSLGNAGHLPFLDSSRKTLKSGCLSLLTIRSFSAREGLGLTVMAWVWLGFGLGVRLGLSDSLSDVGYRLVYELAMWLRGYSRLKKVGLSRTLLAARTCKVAARHPDYNRAHSSPSSLILLSVKH